MPDFTLQRRLSRRFAGGPVAGIDEAGRGPLAGPVVAAAVAFRSVRLPKAVRDGIDDSKRLTRERREAMFDAIQDMRGCGTVDVGVGIADVAEIDRHNILRATFMAMHRAVTALAPCPVLVLVDGNMAPPLPCAAETVIGGDRLCISIAAASIVAKVTRDRLMTALAMAYPGYGWETNVGYGTAEHCSALTRLGVTAHHRRSFAPVRNALNPNEIDVATRVTQDAFPWGELETLTTAGSS